LAKRIAPIGGENLSQAISMSPGLIAGHGFIGRRYANPHQAS
jgi:hypothetical protein